MGTEAFERNGRVMDYRTLPLSQMQAIVSRFEERVNAAQSGNPATKGSVKKAISRAGAQRCPVRLNRLSMDVIVRYGDALADLFCLFPDDLVFVQAYEFTIGYQTPDQKDHISRLQALMQAGEWTDEWGMRSGE